MPTDEQYYRTHGYGWAWAWVWAPNVGLCFQPTKLGLELKSIGHNPTNSVPSENVVPKG
jgi:hypothetical protein